MKRLPALLLSILIGASTVSAQVPPGVAPSVPQPEPMPEGLTSCFDTYHFGSVPAAVRPLISSTVPSATVAFTGEIQNQNDYPLIDVSVHAKIFRERSALKDPFGPDVVDWMLVADRVNLKAGESRPITFEWQVPVNAPSGTYYAATYVLSHDRFNMAGLTFTDDVVGSITQFTVTDSQATGTVAFAKDGITVAGLPFYFAAFPPVVPPGTTDVPITATLTNTTDVPAIGTITWKLYWWDAASDRTFIESTEQEYGIHPYSTTTLTYTVKDTEHTVYYVVGELATPQGTKSIVGVRFVRADVLTPRLNFVGAGTGPNGMQAVACVHSMGIAAAPDSRVELTVTRNEWWMLPLRLLGLGTVAEAEYEGPIPGDIYALAAPLSGEARNIDVSARLYQNGRLVDKARISYGCDITPEGCNTVQSWITVAVALLLALVVAGLLIRTRRTRPVTPVV